MLVLDPSAIAASLGVVRDDRLNVMPHERAEAVHVPPAHFLLFRSGEIGLNAVALALVAGIVKVPMHDIQYVQERLVLHHEGRFIPLVALNEAWDMAEDEFIPVIVLGQDGAFVGLIVDHIVDIVEGVFEMCIRDRFLDPRQEFSGNGRLLVAFQATASPCIRKQALPLRFFR